jgi:hypothetical protein
MTFGKIDDPVGASFEAWQEESPSLGQQIFDLALPFVSLVSLDAKIVQILKDRFTAKAKIERINYLLKGLRLGLERVVAEVDNTAEKLSAVEAKLSDERFLEAVSVACEESSRATNLKSVKRMAEVLVGFASPDTSRWAAPDEEIAVMIRDIAHLSERDLRVLGILATVHANALSYAPNLQDPHQFSKETPKLKIEVTKSGIHPDDFLSACERLRGFGLGAEVLRNSSHMGLEDFCYRPTRRGLALLDYLKRGSELSTTPNPTS